MGKFYDEIPDFLMPWIGQQKMFWVASAPLKADGHINLSPKGFEDTFHIVNSKQVWYEDMTGSGIETVSHLRENGRITILFTAFEGPPRICRLFGRGTVYEFDTPEYATLIPLEKRQPGSRAVIMIDVYKVGTTCGYAVPFYTFKGHRMRLHTFFAQKQNEDIKAEEEEIPVIHDATFDPSLPRSEQGLKWYWKERNAKSLDGLPGLHSASESKLRFPYINPDSFKKDDERIPKSILDGRWVNLQTVAAFALGAATATTVMRMLRQ